MSDQANRPPLVGLRRPDGSVTVPPAAAAEVLRLLSRALVADARSYGGQPSPLCRRLLADLYAAAHYDQAPAATGRTPAVVSVAEAAARMGCSPRWVRRLLATGRLTGRKAGGTWLVCVPDPEAGTGWRASIGA